MFELDLEGTRFEFELENYKKSTKENWDVEWCVVTARVYSDVLKYSLHSSCLLCCEVELLYQKLVELENGEIVDTTEIENIEPDFEYLLCHVASGAYYMEWKFNLWNEGCLTANSFTITLNEEDIKKLREYLYSIINQ